MLVLLGNGRTITMVLSDRGSAFISLRSAFRRSRFDIFELLNHSAEGQKNPNKHLPRRIKGTHTTFQHVVYLIGKKQIKHHHLWGHTTGYLGFA